PHAAKLSPPPPPPGLVPRARLIARLENAPRLALVVAPAGFGKTTLLTLWLAGRLASRAGIEGEGIDHPESAGAAAGRSMLDAPRAAWVTLDERDNDPARFWGAVAAALDTTAPGLGDHARSMLQSPTPPPADVVAGALADELARLAGPCLLVLDDYHLI